MSAESRYTLYHPRWYRRRVSVWWWLQNRAYAGFVLRELTSVFVAFFAGVTLWRSEEHTSELQSPCNLVCRLLLEKKNRDGRIASLLFPALVVCLLRDLLH